MPKYGWHNCAVHMLEWLCIPAKLQDVKFATVTNIKITDIYIENSD